MNIFDFLNEQVEEQTQVKDVRTEKQEGNQFSYDAGEKLEGSKKELRSLTTAFALDFSLDILAQIESVSAQDALSVINRDTIIPFSLEQEKENGVEAAAAKLKQLTIRRIDSKPNTDSALARKMYVLACKELAASLSAIKTTSDWKNFVVGANHRLFDAMNAFRKKHKSTFSQAFAKQEDLSIEDDALNYVALGKKFVNLLMDGTSLSSTYSRVINKNDSWENLLSKKEVKKTTRGKAVWERKIPEHIKRIGKDVPVATKPEDLISIFGLKGVQFGHYVSEHHAKEHIEQVSQALYDLAAVLEIPYDCIGLGGRLGLAIGARGSGRALGHYEPGTQVINLTRDKGIGVLAHEWLHGLDHYLYDCSYDFTNGQTGYLSEGTHGLDLPEEVITTAKEVVKSFREGKVKDAMDVEPAQKIRYSSYGSIPSAYKAYRGNVTSIFQAEYNQQMQKLKYVDEQKLKSMQRKIKKHLENYAYALTCYHHGQTGEWINTIFFEKEGTYFYQTALELDAGKSKKYWSTNVEMFARAFESYVNLKLYAKGERNDYLVCGTHDFVYPQNEEAANMYKKMEQFRLAVSSFMRGERENETYIAS